MVLPILVVDGADVSVHNSLDDAEARLEPKDVHDRSCAAYDAHGYPLDLVIARKRRRILFGLISTHVEVVRMVESTGRQNQEPRLREAMITFLLARKANRVELEHMPTAQLISAVSANLKGR